MLPDGDSIHTFRNSVAGVLIGCDWDRDELEETIRECKCEIGGEACQKANHGLVVWSDGPLFVECRDGIDYEQFEYLD